MSGAGDKLRAERARFEKELASPGVIPDPAIGADDARHFLADTPEAPADDSVWDDEGDDDPREEAPARPGPSTRAKVAMPTTPYLAATRDAAAAKPPPSPTLPTPSPDLTVNIRAALDAAEKGLRASVVARTEMERLAASRGAGRRPGGTAAFARPHAASPKTPVIGAAGETFSLAALPRPTDAQALASLGFENEDDPEAQAYLKGVLRMLYDEERAPEARSPGGTTPGAASESGRLGDASERERVVSRRAHSRSPGSVASAASPAGATTTPAEDQKTTPETTVSSAKGSNSGGADGGERSDEGTAAGPSLTAASPLRGSFAFAPDGGAAGLEAEEDMKEDTSTAPPLVGSAAPGGSPAVLPPTPGLPPTPSAPNADAAAVPSAFPSAAAAAEHATAEIRASYAAWGGRRDAGPSVTPEMVSELDALEREYVRVGGGARKAEETVARDGAAPRVKETEETPAKKTAANKRPRPATPSPAKTPAARASPYPPASRRDVIMAAGDSVPMPSFEPKPEPTPRAAASSRDAKRVDAREEGAIDRVVVESGGGGKEKGPEKGSSSSGALAAPARAALEATRVAASPPDDAVDAAEGDAAARERAARRSDAAAKADAARRRDAREKVRGLLGGAFDYAEARKVVELARRHVKRGGGSSRVDFVDASSVAPFADERLRSTSGSPADSDLDFFAEVEAAASAAGRGGLADASDADASAEAFRAAMRAEVATRIVASRSGVAAEAAKATLARRSTPRTSAGPAGAKRGAAAAGPNPPRRGSERPRAASDRTSARTSSRDGARRPVRGAWQPPPPRGGGSPGGGRSRSAPPHGRRDPSESAAEARLDAAAPAPAAEAPAAFGDVSAAAERRRAKAQRAERRRAAAERARERELAEIAEAAESKRVAAEKLRATRAAKVAFGRTARGGDAEKRKRRKPSRPKNTEVKPFNLSVGNSKPPPAVERRDPDVWASDDGEGGEGGEGGGGGSPDSSIRATPRRRPLEETLAEAARSKARADRRDAARWSGRGSAHRDSLIVAAASRVAAPAVAAAEAARRDAEAAAAAAARAAEAAKTAEAAMLAEARRLRERRKEMFAPGREHRADFVPARAFAASGAARDASLFADEDDATPLMASAEGADAFFAFPETRRAEEEENRGDAARLDARTAATRASAGEPAGADPGPTDEPIASPSPEKLRASDEERAERAERASLRRDGSPADADASGARSDRRSPRTLDAARRERRRGDGPPSPQTPPSPVSPADSRERGGLGESSAARQALLFPDAGEEEDEGLDGALALPPAIAEPLGAPRGDAGVRNAPKQPPSKLESARNARAAAALEAAAKARAAKLAGEAEAEAEVEAARSSRDDAAAAAAAARAKGESGVGRFHLLRGSELAYEPPALVPEADDGEEEGEDAARARHAAWLSRASVGSSAAFGGGGGDGSFDESGGEDGDLRDVSLDVTRDAVEAVATKMREYYAERSHPEKRAEALRAAREGDARDEGRDDEEDDA